MIVIDASVAAKWFLPEKQSAAAADLLSLGRKLLAPDLLRHEVTSAIAKAARMDKITTEEARGMIERWGKMLERHMVSLVAAEAEFASAVRLCLDLRHPLYDCFYLVVAQRLKIPLAITDHRLTQQAGKIGVELFTLS